MLEDPVILKRRAEFEVYKENLQREEEYLILLKKRKQQKILEEQELTRSSFTSNRRFFNLGIEHRKKIAQNKKEIAQIDVELQAVESNLKYNKVKIEEHKKLFPLFGCSISFSNLKGDPIPSIISAQKGGVVTCEYDSTQKESLKLIVPKKTAAKKTAENKVPPEKKETQTLQLAYVPDQQRLDVEFPKELPADAEDPLYKQALSGILDSIPPGTKIIIERDLGENPSSHPLVLYLIKRGVPPQNISFSKIKNPARYGKKSNEELTLADIKKPLSGFDLIIGMFKAELREDAFQHFDTASDATNWIMRLGNWLLHAFQIVIPGFAEFAVARSPLSPTFEAGKGMISANENGLLHTHTVYRVFTYTMLISAILFVSAIPALFYGIGSVLRWSWAMRAAGQDIKKIKAKQLELNDEKAEVVCKEMEQLLKYPRLLESITDPASRTMIKVAIEQYRNAKKAFQADFERYLGPEKTPYELALCEDFIRARKELITALQDKNIKWERRPNVLRRIWDSIGGYILRDPILVSRPDTYNPFLYKINALQQHTQQLETSLSNPHSREREKLLTYDPGKLAEELEQKEYEYKRFKTFMWTYISITIGGIFTVSGAPYIGGPFFIGGGFGLIYLAGQRLKRSAEKGPPKKEILKIRPQTELDAEQKEKEEKRALKDKKPKKVVEEVLEIVEEKKPMPLDDEKVESICKEAMRLSSSLLDKKIIQDAIAKYKKEKKEAFSNKFKPRLQKNKFIAASEKLLTQLKTVRWEKRESKGVLENMSDFIWGTAAAAQPSSSMPGKLKQLKEYINKLKISFRNEDKEEKKERWIPMEKHGQSFLIGGLYSWWSSSEQPYQELDSSDEEEEEIELNDNFKL